MVPLKLSMPKVPVLDTVMVPALLMVPPSLKMPMPPVFDIVMMPLAELLMVPPELLVIPKNWEFDTVMLPVAELLMVPPELLKMPLPPPEFDAVRVPELLMVPSLLIVPVLVNVPVDVISMVPVALFVSVLVLVTRPFMITVLVDSLVREPVAPIISSEPISTVSVPVVSVKGISSVTDTPPSIMIVSEPVGSMLLLQLDESDHAPVAPLTQTPFGRTLIIRASRATPSKLFPSPPKPTTKSIVSPLFNDEIVAKLVKSAFPRNIGHLSRNQ